ncbi:MAG: hypothetical protein ACYC4U_05270 [Pirellulaceae bacterium]
MASQRIGAFLGILMWAAVCPGQCNPTVNPGVAWPATDALGRVLPLTQTVGEPRAQRTVAMFYFLWHETAWQQGPFDVTKILAADSLAMQKNTSPPWGPLHFPHHWGESLFGYYVGDDESVLRKHAQMLSDAGVDVLIFDTSNKVTYQHNYTTLLRVFQQVRAEGNRTPQVAFLTPFWDPASTVRELYEQLYSQHLFEDLWFRWDGKPLVLADPNLLFEKTERQGYTTPVPLELGHTAGQTFQIPETFGAVYAYFPTYRSVDSAITLTLRCDGPTGKTVAAKRFSGVVDNGCLVLEVAEAQPPGVYYLEASDAKGPIGWWSSPGDVCQGGCAFVDGQPVEGDRSGGYLAPDATVKAIQSFFTFRKPQPDYFQGPTGADQWAWLEVYPQHVFRNSRGEKEQMSVGSAQNAVGNRLGCMSEPGARGRSFHAGSPSIEPDSVHFGHNAREQWERALQEDPQAVFVTGWNEWIAGRFEEFNGIRTPPMFVDQFDQEHSRDIEPMRGGHGDNYYYQFVDYVRRYKGVPAIAPASQKTITIDGQFSDWSDVIPEFPDTIADPVHRQHVGWGSAGPYTNQTGRNDIVLAKACYDDQNVYFYVRTREPMTPCTDPRWMLLLIDADSRASTGWLGYDVVVNKSAATPNSTSLQHCTETADGWQEPIAVACHVGGQEMELSVPRAELRCTDRPPQCDFKWADNILETGEASDFTLNGDVAPNDRFNFRLHSGASMQPASGR